MNLLPSLSLVLLATTAFGATAFAAPSAELIERYATDRAALEEFHAPRSAARTLDRLDAHSEEWLAIVEAAALEERSRLERIELAMLREHLRHDLAARGFARARLEAAKAIVPHFEELAALEANRRAMLECDAKAAADLLQRAVDAIGKRRESDSEGIEPTVALRAARLVRELEGALATWHDHHARYEPGFAWWTEKPYAALEEELEAYRKHLREEVAGATGDEDDPLVGTPIGREALLEDLRHEWIPYSPEELLEIGEAEMRWCQREMERVAGELGVATWLEAVEHVKGLHADAGGQPEVVTAQAREMIEFLDERGLVSVDDLCRELWRVDMISARGQRTLPYAAYGGMRMLVAYPTDEMTHAEKCACMRGNNRHFSRIVTPHELIPGHHLQRYIAARENVHRRIFGTPFYVEGWALHWEMRLWDLGWARGPEDEVGMLFWRSHRCARIVVSLRYHLGEMEPEAMIDYLVDRIGHEREAATSEVRRYIGGNYSPLYQCAYMIGGLQLRALHRELVLEGDMPERTFHDLVLEANSIPIEFLRTLLRDDVDLPGDEPSWRFGE